MPGARVASGKRVTLRTLEREDLPFLQRAYADPALRIPLGWDVKSRAEIEAEFEENLGDDERFLVCLDGEDAGPAGPDDPADVRPIGAIGLATHERARTGIGAWIAPAVQGEGYGKEAVSLALDYVFRVYPHPAVYAKTLPDNDASRGLLESLGFSRDGRLREEAFWDGRYRDSIAYSLLREEWTGAD